MPILSKRQFCIVLLKDDAFPDGIMLIHGHVDLLHFFYKQFWNKWFYSLTNFFHWRFKIIDRLIGVNVWRLILTGKGFQVCLTDFVQILKCSGLKSKWHVFSLSAVETIQEVQMALNFWYYFFLSIDDILEKNQKYVTLVSLCRTTNLMFLFAKLKNNISRLVFRNVVLLLKRVIIEFWHLII